ncbi:hypothetical protein AK812_SmicGene27431 [Symbiodinium microadriaticum]|uniref:Uncharacterized protein n=1 Tax=Symbiodinium microadriaticum TaxID=2951 RepID=A0A1Q9D6Y0_SYMMI|nr:hypothetical protein AK812_SmicGene27431 [Symbiodinium microadriaticum]
MASAAHRVCAMLLLRRRKRRHFDRTACTTSPPVVQNATPETLETTILQSLIEWEGLRAQPLIPELGPARRCQLDSRVFVARLGQVDNRPMADFFGERDGAQHRGACAKAVKTSLSWKLAVLASLDTSVKIFLHQPEVQDVAPGQQEFRCMQAQYGRCRRERQETAPSTGVPVRRHIQNLSGGRWLHKLEDLFASSGRSDAGNPMLARAAVMSAAAGSDATQRHFLSNHPLARSEAEPPEPSSRALKGFMRQVEALSWSVHLLLCLGLTEPFLKPGKQKTRPDQTPHCVCFTICEPPWEFGGDA